MTTIGFALALWVMGSSLLIPLARLRARQTLPGAVLGMAIAHFGVGAGDTGHHGRAVVQDRAGRRARSRRRRDDRRLRLPAGGAARCQGPEFRSPSKRMSSCRRTAVAITTLHPQKRLYNSGGNAMTEAGIEVGAGRDLFAALGEDLGQGRWSLRLQYKPLIRYIWLGRIADRARRWHRRPRSALSAHHRGRSRPKRRGSGALRDEAEPALPGAGSPVRRLDRVFRHRPAIESGRNPLAVDRQARTRVHARIAGRSWRRRSVRRPTQAGRGSSMSGRPGAAAAARNMTRYLRSRARTGFR